MVERALKVSMVFRADILIAGILMAAAGATYVSCRRFRHHLMDESCGIKPGMSLAEAEQLLAGCGDVQKGPSPLGYMINPRWLAVPAGWSGYYGIYLELDAHGKIKLAAPTDAYDF